MRLAAYDFDIEYVIGAKNIADPLSSLCEQNDLHRTMKRIEIKKYAIEWSVKAIGEEENAITIKTIQSNHRNFICT